MENKRQKQIAEIVRRNFGIILQQEGSYIYGAEPLVTVTGVKMSPDMGLAKIYLSVYNLEDKQNVILQLEQHYPRVKSLLQHRIKRHIRRMPNFRVYLDDTLDEMYKLNELFNKLDESNQMGKKSEDPEQDQSETTK